MVKAKEMGIIDRILYGSDYWVTGSGVFSRQRGEDMKRWIKLIRTGDIETAERCGWPTKESIEGSLLLCIYRGSVRHANYGEYYLRSRAEMAKFDPKMFSVTGEYLTATR